MLSVSLWHSRIVEIRACSDGPAYVVDWAGNDGAIMVSGNAIWEGNMAFKGGLVGQEQRDLYPMSHAGSLGGFSRSLLRQKQQQICMHLSGHQLNCHTMSAVSC
jgi:hypothetical protein